MMFPISCMSVDCWRVAILALFQQLLCLFICLFVDAAATQQFVILRGLISSLRLGAPVAVVPIWTLGRGVPPTPSRLWCLCELEKLGKCPLHVVIIVVPSDLRLEKSRFVIGSCRRSFLNISTSKNFCWT